MVKKRGPLLTTVVGEPHSARQHPRRRTALRHGSTTLPRSDRCPPAHPWPPATPSCNAARLEEEVKAAERQLEREVAANALARGKVALLLALYHANTALQVGRAGGRACHLCSA